MRRRLLLAAGAAPLAAALPARAAGVRGLRLTHLHTGERLAATYWEDGRYRPDALAAIDRLLRDFRTGEVAPIDPALLNLLHALQVATGTGSPFEVICGFRSSRTNAALQERGGAHSGVATRSLHLEGRAIDVRLADVPLTRLRDAALALRRGGVGFYPASAFVHVDTGRPRAW